MSVEQVRIRVVVNPTESTEKVRRAVTNVLGDIDLKARQEGSLAILEGELGGIESLEHLKGVVRRDRIRDSVRGLLTRAAEGGRLSFGLNKQAAYAGHVSFYHEREAPLGSIQITIMGDAEGAIRYLCE